jgi:hypothetical protein
MMTFCFLRRLGGKRMLPRATERTFCGDSAFRSATGGCVERRRAARFLLRCPAIFEWTDQKGRPQVGAGFTRDISTLGVFVLSTASPSGEGTLRMQIVLPPQPDEEGLKLQSMASVVRVEKQRAGSGFAVRSEFALVAEAAGEPRGSERASNQAVGASARRANPSQMRVGSGGH